MATIDLTQLPTKAQIDFSQMPDQTTPANDIVAGLDPIPEELKWYDVPGRMESAGDTVAGGFTQGVNRSSTGINQMIGSFTGDGYYDTATKQWIKGEEGFKSRAKELGIGALKTVGGGMEAFISLAYSPWLAAFGAAKPEIKKAVEGYSMAFDMTVPEETKKAFVETGQQIKEVWLDIPEQDRELIANGWRVVLDTVITKGIMGNKAPVPGKQPTVQQTLHQPIGQTAGEMKTVLGEPALAAAKATVRAPFVAGQKVTGAIKDTTKRLIEKALPENKVAAAKTINSSIRVGKKQLQEFQKYTGASKKGTALPGQGETPGKWIVDRGLQKGDTAYSINERITENTSKFLRNQVTAKDRAMQLISKNPAAQGIKDPSVTKALKELIKFYEKTGDKNLAHARRLLKQANTKGLDLKQIDQWVKYRFEHDIKFSYMNAGADPVGAARAKNIDSGLRNLTYRVAEDAGFKEIIAANREIQAANKILNIIGPQASKELAMATAKGFDSMDYILMVGSTMNPQALITLIAKKTLVERMSTGWKEYQLSRQAGSATKSIIKGSSDLMKNKAKLGVTSQTVAAQTAIKRNVAKAVRKVMTAQAEQMTIDDAITAIEKDIGRQLTIYEVMPVKLEMTKYVRNTHTGTKLPGVGLHGEGATGQLLDDIMTQYQKTGGSASLSTVSGKVIINGTAYSADDAMTLMRKSIQAKKPPLQGLGDEGSNYGFTPATATVATTTTASKFVKAVEKFKKARPEFATQLSPYKAVDYKGMKLFLSPDGASGYAIQPDGTLSNVFSTVKGRGGQLVQEAINNGATKLDAFDYNNYLPKLYGKYGFKEVNRLKWDPKYAPEGWDYKTMGTPDVVEMSLAIS